MTYNHLQQKQERQDRQDRQDRQQVPSVSSPNCCYVFSLCPLANNQGLGKPLTSPRVSLPEWRPMWNGWDGKSLCLNGRPLVGRTANKARDPFFLHLTLHSLPEGIILWGTRLGVGEADDELTPGNIAIILMARRSWINQSSFRYGHCECRVVFVTGPPGPHKTRAPGEISRPGPLSGLARGVFSVRYRAPFRTNGAPRAGY